MQRIAWYFLLAAALVLRVTPAGAQSAATAPAATSKTVRLLTIGNSFSRNATRYLGDLAAGGGHMLVHRPIIVGGASLELHAEKARMHELDADDKTGLYSDGTSLQELLQAEPWDFVTIQQASIKSHDLATYQPFAGRLREIIRRHAPQAQLLVHQTWAYRSDDPRFGVESPKLGEPKTQAEMYDGLSRAYRTITAELNARRVPVGDAFYLCDTDPAWGYRVDRRFDFKTARFPALPDQTHSLHVGWQWKKRPDGKQTLRIDGHHANLAGEYLGACVFYETLFGDSVVGNRFIPAGLDPDYAKFLQAAAHRAVAESK